MDVTHVQWRWLAILAVGVLVASVVVAAAANVSVASVFFPFAGMAVLGLVVGWALRHIVRFNPYDY